MNMNDTMNNKRLENLAGVFDSFSSVTAPPAYILDVETKEMLYVSRYPMFIAGYTAAEAKAKGKSFFMETCVFACRFGFGPVAERGHRLRGCRKREWDVWRTEFLHFVPVGCGIG